MPCSMARFSIICLTLCLALAGLAGIITGLERVTPAMALPDPFIVSNSNDSGPGSLRQAIVEANALAGADVISITAVGIIQLLNPLPVISQALTIRGPGAGQLAVDGGDTFRVFDSTVVPVTLAGLTVQRGRVAGASDTGAGIRSTGSLTLSNVTVISNTAQSHGGGVHVLGKLVVTNSRFQNNHSITGIGGGLRSNNLTIISGTQFLNNSSQGDGGAAFTLSQIAMTNTLFQGNACLATSCDGGGLFSFSQTTLNHTQFLSNIAQDQGGGAVAPGNLIINNGLFQNNQAIFGSGGGLVAQNVATIHASHFLSNTARSNGGGLYSLGAITVTASLFDSNQSIQAAGGGLNAFGRLLVQATSFLNNVANSGGGLRHGFEDGRIINTLFANNQATAETGAALSLASSAAVELIHVTIAGPNLTPGSALAVLTGTVGITNTIIASHTVGISNSGGLVTQDYNLFFANTTNTQGPLSGGLHNVSGDPAFIAPAQANYHLGDGSMALDSGVNADILTDYDGENRPLDNAFDIGFDEANFIAGLSFIFTPSPATVNLPLLFTAVVTHGTGLSYQWDFGDGSAVAAGNPVSHTFTLPGAYPVAVTATNSAGSLSFTAAVNIGQHNKQLYLPLLLR